MYSVYAQFQYIFVTDDHSRVPLTAELPGESEYINACFINVTRHKLIGIIHQLYHLYFSSSLPVYIYSFRSKLYINVTILSLNMSCVRLHVMHPC